MELLTVEFDWQGKRGRLGWDGCFVWVGSDARMPSLPIAPGSAILCQLPNAAIIKYGAGVPCWESPYPGCVEPPAGQKGDW
jgi:hypothetical protein